MWSYDEHVSLDLELKKQAAEMCPQLNNVRISDNNWACLHMIRNRNILFFFFSGI